MKPIPLRIQLDVVAAGYAGVLATATVLVAVRYLQYVGFSRLLARFDRAKRLTLYALLIEVLTFVSMAALLLLPARAHPE